MYNSAKVVDGYALSSASSNSFVSNWIDIRSYAYVSISTVFTGGNPQGTLLSEVSNDRQFSGGYSVMPLYAAGAENSAGANKFISDAIDKFSFEPFDNWAQNKQVVNGPGIYVLDEKLTPFGWFRVKYTASSNVNTQLDIFLTTYSDK